ncbi:L,D-transpeptidase family protein [Sphingomonas prati]|uniref:Murein L,D-transpeptidase YcbB/YkuD n=1 Tax=Sphingomonas prati TaxID=1843237 RepID=A0A7W9BQP7_9SPHN|nr:L,D-transpeptidase family protein [Sphingomonas prati]MBB5728354.1 murein L,D-transpeptidase YcbB/YkuD [Sphingomonas prati]
MKLKTMRVRRTHAGRTLPMVLAALAAISIPHGGMAQTPSTDSIPVAKTAVTGPIVANVYAKVGWRTIWTPGLIAAFDRVLEDRGRHGLDRVAFLPDPLPAASPVAADIARTEAALAYAAALAYGRVDPATLHTVYTLPKAKADLAAGLAGALAVDRLAAWFDGLAPQDDEYRQLSAAYLTFRAKASVAPAAQPIAAGLIRVGDRDARVAAVVEQLTENGYFTPATAAARTGPVRYTQAMADALKALQDDYGIASDGVVGPDTLKVINLGPGDRARAIAVALERRRWLSRTTPETRIDVNTAAAQLRYYRASTLADERKVIVGEPGHETPPLASPIFRLVANPTWTVPKSIQNGEMANTDEAYLAAHNMVLKDGWIVQQPGPDNALGLVKFDMANDQAIYLHDTSAPALFGRSQRHLSHGCVRVEDAQGFAQMIAEDQGIGSEWYVAQASGETQFVPIPTRIPVRLLYHTVFVDDAGRVAFRTDAYGWNDPVAERLGFTPNAARKVEAKAIDIGP